MTARAWESGQDHDGLLDTQIEEGQASLDAYESSIVPLEDFMPEEDRPLSKEEELTIEAARSGIIMLCRVIEDIKAGREKTFTLLEIGRAIAADSTL